MGIFSLFSGIICHGIEVFKFEEIKIALYLLHTFYEKIFKWLIYQIVDLRCFGVHKFKKYLF